MLCYNNCIYNYHFSCTVDRLVSFPCLEPQEALPTFVFVILKMQKLLLIIKKFTYRDSHCAFTFCVQKTETLTVQCSSTCWVVNRSINRETLGVDFKLKLFHLLVAFCRFSTEICFTFWLPFVDFHVKNVHLLVATVGTDIDTDSHLPKNISSLKNHLISI